MEYENESLMFVAWGNLKCFNALYLDVIFQRCNEEPVFKSKLNLF